MNLFRFIPGYETHIYDANKEPLLFLFLAFLITFALTRLYTRSARKHGWGSGSVGGVHMHHMVPGVILMVVGGILGFTQYGYIEIVYGIAAILFGAGLALTLDEFAMILHLEDVYWTNEGRTSIDATIMGVAASGLLLVSSSPVGEGGSSGDGGGALQLELGPISLEIGVFVALAIALVLATITFLKKKPFMGILALLLPFVGAVTATRLAKPGSPWAHWFYDPDRGRRPRSRARRLRKLERSVNRFDEGRWGRFERWFSDLIGGTPTLPPAAVDDARSE